MSCIKLNINTKVRCRDLGIKLCGSCSNMIYHRCWIDLTRKEILHNLKLLPDLSEMKNIIVESIKYHKKHNFDIYYVGVAIRYYLPECYNTYRRLAILI